MNYTVNEDRREPCKGRGIERQEFHSRVIVGILLSVRAERAPVTFIDLEADFKWLLDHAKTIYELFRKG